MAFVPAARLHLRGWLVVASLGGAAGYLVGRPEPANPVPAPASAPKLADHRVIVADLLSRGPAMPDCGWLQLETPMVFADIYADSATMTVMVPCADLARPSYSLIAGNAEVLRKGARYRLELSGPLPDVAGNSDSRWRAERIDAVERFTNVATVEMLTSDDGRSVSMIPIE